MRRRHPLPSRVLGLVLAVLALFGQLSVGLAMPMPDPVGGAPASFDPVFPICHVEAPLESGRDVPPAHGHHRMDCALCPLCSALAAVAVLPAPGPPLLAPAASPVRAGALPPARAPPVAAVLAATFPTGPPRLS